MPDYERGQNSFIEFGLKISFTPCFYLLEYQQVILYRTLAFEQLCSAMQKSMKHNTAVERCNK